MLGLLLIWISKILRSIGYFLNLNPDKAINELTWDIEISGPDTIDNIKFKLCTILKPPDPPTK